MKRQLFLAVAAAGLVAGCGEQNSSAPGTNAPSGSTPLTAPVDYLSAAGKAKQSAARTVDTAALNQAIQMFNVEHGRYPKDLDELVQKQFIPKIPDPPYGSKIVYDASKGEAKVVKQ